MGIIETLLGNPAIQTLLVGGLGWLVNKVRGERKDSRTRQFSAAMLEAVALGGQALLVEQFPTRDALVIRLKGIVAVTLAKAKIYEKQRAPFQPLIDAAIAELVERWTKAHPTPSELPPVKLRGA
jgi:hypothetical protein